MAGQRRIGAGIGLAVLAILAATGLAWWLMPPAALIGPEDTVDGTVALIRSWGAWGMLGVVMGHIWIRQAAAHGQARVFLLTGLLGVLCTTAVNVVRAIDPHPIALLVEPGTASADDDGVPEDLMW